MGEDVALHIGAADLSSGDLSSIVVMALLGCCIPFIRWAHWHFRDRRIRRAEVQGETDRSEILALDHDVQGPPRTLREIAGDMAFMLVGIPALLIFQMNFADELEHMLGKGWGFVAWLLTLAFLIACGWMWQKVKRNAMSPDELAALEEEEEHQRWMRSLEGDGMAALGFGVAGGLLVMFGIIYFLSNGIPG